MNWRLALRRPPTFPSNSGHSVQGPYSFGGCHRAKTSKLIYLKSRGICDSFLSTKTTSLKLNFFRNLWTVLDYDHCTDIRFSTAMAHNVRIKPLYFSKQKKTKLPIFTVWNPPSAKLSALMEFCQIQPQFCCYSMNSNHEETTILIVLAEEKFVVWVVKRGITNCKTWVNA